MSDQLADGILTVCQGSAPAFPSGSGQVRYKEDRNPMTFRINREKPVILGFSMR
ncbi:MAG: hypothetical protein QNJ78_11640 [Gammaproteobacteria bacterium]|nr:hypothetical protein [Gammaproteobacteria bacterium]